MSGCETNPSIADQLSVTVSDSPGPRTHEEARQFHIGFLSGATAYAAAVGDSTIKSNNPKLCEVFAEQGRRTLSTLDALNHVCQHGVREGEWCEPCNQEHKTARNEND